MTLNEYLALVLNNVNTNKWLNCTESVVIDNKMYSIGIKAFGKWVQRIEICGLVSNIPEQKTKKALKSLLENEILKIVNKL